MPLAVSSPDIMLLFSGAGLVLYTASRAAVDALTATGDPNPGRMALGQWMPIAWSALLATAVGHTEIGIGLTFSTSVAALALDLGELLVLAPAQEFVPRRSRAWPFVLPAAILPLLAGFTATLTWLHALMMLLLGVAVFSAWTIGDHPAEHAGVATGAEPKQVLPFRRIRIIQLIISIGLGAVGAWLGFLAVMAADAKTRVATSGLIAAAILSPLLALPILGTGAIAAQNKRMGAVVANLVGIVLLNLCVLLPLVVLVDYARHIIILFNSGIREIPALVFTLRPVPFPLGVWRLDGVLLLALALLLVPVSLGRWKLERAEGLALAFGYVAYLIASAALTIRL